MGLIVLSVLEEDLVHIGAGVLVQLVARAEDNEGDLTVTEHGQLVGLLHDAELSLVKRHLREHKNDWVLTNNSSFQNSPVCFSRL